MFHKNVLTSSGGVFPQQLAKLSKSSNNTSNSTQRLLLVPPTGGAVPQKTSSTFFNLVVVAAPRCSAFFAEAAVLVLVLALLDRLMSKGHMEIDWAISAIVISLLLLAASIATDYASRRWLQRH